MSKRQVRFSENASDDLGEPQSRRFKDSNTIDSDDEENVDDGNEKNKSNENILTEDDIEGANYVFNRCKNISKSEKMCMVLPFNSLKPSRNSFDVVILRKIPDLSLKAM